MDCSKYPGCKSEFRLNRDQRDAALNRAFQLDSAKGDIPGAYPYRWTVMRPTLIVLNFSPQEQHWFYFTEDEGLPGIGVHIIVYLVVGSKLQFSIDTRKHKQAELFFKSQLLRQHRLTITVPQNDEDQDRQLLRQEMDEAKLPDSWRPKSPPPSNPPPPPPSGYA